MTTSHERPVPSDIRHGSTVFTEQACRPGLGLISYPVEAVYVICASFHRHDRSVPILVRITENEATTQCLLQVWRRATMGSTCAARRAGITAAIIATSAINTATAVSTIGSLGLVRMSRF